MPYLTFLEIRGLGFTNQALLNKPRLETVIIESPNMTNSSLDNLDFLMDITLQGPHFTKDVILQRPSLKKCFINGGQVILQ
jgi:hypothetical protein